MFRKRKICSPLVAGVLLLLPMITIVADNFLRDLSNDNVPIVWRALFDSSAHVVLGILAWLAVTLDRNKSEVQFDLLLSAFFSAGVDVDHFIVARSFKLEDALHMASAPPFHDVLLPFMTFLTAVVLFCVKRGRMWNIRYHLLQLSTMMVVHLFRDAARRGLRVGYLFLIPPGSPFGRFPFFLPFCPLFMRCVLLLTDMGSEDVVVQDAAGDGRDSPLTIVSDDMSEADYLYSADADENYRGTVY